MNKFEWVTQVIAQPYEVQKSLFPDFANIADELAVEWEMVLEELDYSGVFSSLTDAQQFVIR